MEAYKRAGRGGAGNFWSKKDIDEVIKKDSGDVESQKSSSTTTTSTQAPPEYLHSGRGGAGNWVKPSDLAASGLSQNTADNAPTSTEPSKKTPVVGQSKPTYRGGRGGAGNYYEDPAIEEKRKAEEEEARRLAMDKQVERDVEAGLAKPARAYGGLNGGAYELKESGSRN